MSKPKRLDAGQLICGSLTALLRGLPRDENFVNSLIGTGINNSKGEYIGYISKVDLENDTWYGRITNASENRTLIENLSSMEMRISDK